MFLEVSIFIPIFVIIFLSYILSKKIKYNLFIVILAFIYFYYKNILFIRHTIKAFSTPKSIDKENSNIKKIVNRMFNDLFVLNLDFANIPSVQTIFVANYPVSYYDSFSTMLIPSNIAIVMQDNFLTRLTWNKIIYKSIFRKKKYGKSYNNIKREIKKCVNDGLSILGYVTTDSNINICRVRTGLFRIAQELNIPVTPLVFDTVNISNFRITEQNFQIYTGNSFYVSDPEKDCRKVKKLFKEKIQLFKETKFKKLK